MRILVTGASGFAGSALIKYLVGINNADITAIVHKTPVQVSHQHIRYVQSSIEDLPAFLKGEPEFDYIFHLARIPGKRFGNIGRILAGLQGARANKKILKAISGKGCKTRLVYLSGSLMYGHQPGKTSVEADSLHPAGFAKYYHLAEKPLLKAISNNTANIVMLRAPWIVGNGSWFAKLYEEHVLKQKKVPIYGNPDRHMSLISVDDCAGMLWHYATNAQASGIYNIYTVGKLSYMQFLNYIAKAYDTENYIAYNEEKMLKFADKTTVDSICCEVVLDTQYKDLLNSYKPIHNNPEIYIAQLAQYDNNK